MGGEPTGLGTVVNGRYRLESLLGEGGMGAVYRAVDLRGGGVLAVKIIRANFLANPRVAQRFRREAEAVARVRHPNVVAVFELGLAPDVGLYIAMECLEGRTLRAEIDTRGALTPDEALDCARQACAGIAAAHLVGIVHRDVKPENVFLTVSPFPNVVKVLDFGVAKLLDAADGSTSVLASAGAFLGTPAYASPEQWARERVDARSDVYALGCVIYEMLTGRPPFVSDRRGDLMRKHLSVVPEPPSLHAHVDPRLDAAILRALAKDPAQRFETAGALGRALFGTW
jgi:serine/threonine-protein kinase